ncbi:MAG: molecular chaperone [Sphingomonas sp.]|uniref:fimbria/pilus periplasmic chaperone n=1 Tax=Sphingomonas sp. TaxID=28214 RepID=UPI001B288912|nr:fimbria/pilus periplasmic chaperone [Sphingomonas sp.]MBO9623978.1 molecular chaperone [Sphingomonas sp.]
MFCSFHRIAVRSAIVVAATTMCAASVYAMRVSPMIVEMATVGSDAVARIEVQNLNAGRLPFETRISRLTFDENGVPSETPADADFVVFPPQGMLPQGARQVIRLQWVGGDIPVSQAYYLSVNQLPIPADSAAAGASAQVQVVYHMKALVVVAPPNAEPNVRAISAKQIDFQPPAAPTAKPGDPLPSKVPGIEITMQNSGRRHAMMAALKWVLEGKDPAGKPARVVISEEDLSRGVGSGYVPAGGRRVFRFPLARTFGPGPITVKFMK